jgi:NAD(P)-dependent dehydrogenase (short-subunit alcohol dehydrogenase family)
MASLKGQRVVVVGGSSGMGLAVARAAAAEGARVTIAARNGERLARARASIPGEAESRVLDARDEAAVERFFRDLGSVDHLVTTVHESSAGIGAMRAFGDLEIAAMRRFMDGKFWSQVTAARHAVPVLAPEGSITLFSGVASRKAMPRHTAIASVNGAVEAFARALAHEIRPRRVNVVAPGLTATPTYDAIPEAERAAFFAARGAHLPVGRVGAPEDIAETVLYLMKSGYSTGTVVDIDGGHLVE